MTHSGDLRSRFRSKSRLPCLSLPVRSSRNKWMRGLFVKNTANALLTQAKNNFLPPQTGFLMEDRPRRYALQ